MYLYHMSKFVYWNLDTLPWPSLLPPVAFVPLSTRAHTCRVAPASPWNCWMALRQEVDNTSSITKAYMISVCYTNHFWPGVQFWLAHQSKNHFFFVHKMMLLPYPGSGLEKALSVGLSVFLFSFIFSSPANQIRQLEWHKYVILIIQIWAFRYL